VRTHRIYSLAECAQLARAVPQRPRVAVVGTVVVLVTLVAAVVTWAAVVEADMVVRGPARVRAKSAPKMSFTASSGEQVTASIAGRVEKVLIKEGQEVRPGDALAVLDSQQLENDRARLAAAVANARAARDASERMIALSQSQFDAEQAERAAELAQVLAEEWQGRKRNVAETALARTVLEAAQRESERMTALVGDGAASQMQADQTAQHVREATARLQSAEVGGSTGRAEVLRRQIVLAERTFAVSREDLGQQMSSRVAELTAAERMLANLEVELAKATVRASHHGIVGSVGVRPGDSVQPGQAMFAISPSDGVRIDAAIPAADIGLIHSGMRARVRLEAFDWQRYGTLEGTITQVGTDADTVTTPGSQIPIYVVRVDLDADVIGRGELRGKLKLGMLGVVEIVTERRHLLSLLLGHLHQAVSL
jgi:multidrug resistance efflux pump